LGTNSKQQPQLNRVYVCVRQQDFASLEIALLLVVAAVCCLKPVMYFILSTSSRDFTTSPNCHLSSSGNSGDVFVPGQQQTAVCSAPRPLAARRRNRLDAVRDCCLGRPTDRGWMPALPPSSSPVVEEPSGADDAVETDYWHAADVCSCCYCTPHHLDRRGHAAEVLPDMPANPLSTLTDLCILATCR